MKKEALQKKVNKGLSEVLNRADALEQLAEDIKVMTVEGQEKITELDVQITEVQEIISKTMSLQEAKELQAKISDLQQEKELQSGVNLAKVNSKKSEVVLLFEDFSKSYLNLKALYRELDQVITLEMNIKTVDEDSKLMGKISENAYDAIYHVKEVLISLDIIGVEVRSFGGFHLGQARMATYAHYSTVVKQLKSLKIHFKRAGVL
ncbi:hypothetical protein [Priestia megaterium]|uniref:hypothetical protein n=1 Tax=Priestia megaterium TaxID=1404 RepID=UPI00234E9F38|nr:hypothetical protein [Priestia megaterium]MDC7781849.1 hypothetical protein [Priestia megaterium]